MKWNQRNRKWKKKKVELKVDLWSGQALWWTCESEGPSPWSGIEWGLWHQTEGYAGWGGEAWGQETPPFCQSQCEPWQRRRSQKGWGAWSSAESEWALCTLCAWFLWTHWDSDQVIQNPQILHSYSSSSSSSLRVPSFVLGAIPVSKRNGFEFHPPNPYK